MVKTILTTARNFSRFPFSGRIVPEFGEESIREWFAYSYRVIYRIEGELVMLLRGPSSRELDVTLHSADAEAEFAGPDEQHYRLAA